MQDRAAEEWKEEGEESIMFEGKHIHYSPVDNKPLCSYSAKLCKQRRLNGYAFCIRHILEDKSAPFKQCAHVARYNKQKCTNPIPSNQDREFCNSHMQVAGILPKKERKYKKEKEKDVASPGDGKLKFADRLRALLRNENSALLREDAVDGDPYAFSEPYFEEGKEPPVPCTKLGTTNCVPKMVGEVCNSDQSKTDGKVKCQSSKTMNRLQAKIAQNKLLDKLKKSQDSSHNHMGMSIPIPGESHKEDQCIPCIDATCLADFREENITTFQRVPNNGSLSSLESLDSIPVHSHCETLACDCLEPHQEVTVSGAAVESAKERFVDVKPIVHSKDSRVASIAAVPSGEKTNQTCRNLGRTTTNATCVTVKPKKNVVLCSNYSSKMPVVLRKLQEYLELKKRKRRDLYSFGFESSESDSSESEEESSTTWCRRWQSCWDSRTDREKQCSRASDHCQLKARLRFHYQQLLKMHDLHKREEADHRTILNHLVTSASSFPKHTALLLLQCIKLKQDQQPASKPTQLPRSTCCYQHEGYTCEKPALPYTRHCIRHIMYNVDQLLFEHCTAKFADNTQCCTPVFDISHELPLCLEHAQKRDNYNKMLAEPSPKKPRKKPKPSALTRPPKRGKKKKRQGQQLRPSANPPSPSRCFTESSSSDMPQSLALEQVPIPTENANLPAEVASKELANPLETDLASELEGHLSPENIELPLDTAELANQASKLLEEHDFTEVLNKIPDDAFTDLFAENRNGEYVPTKEETEELERALAAVSKDVHLAKESLAKLSASAHDLPDLETPVDLHASLLSAENLALAENAFHELAQSNLDGLGVMNNNLASNDLSGLGHSFSHVASDRTNHGALVVSENQLLQNPMVTVPLLTSELPQAHVTEALGTNQSMFQNNNSTLSTQFLDGSSFPSLDPSSSVGNYGNISSPVISIPVCHLASHPLSTNENISAPATPVSFAISGSSSPWISSGNETSNYQNGLILGSHTGQAFNLGTQQLLANLCKYSFHNLGGDASIPMDATSVDGIVLCDDGLLETAREDTNLSNGSATLQQSNITATVAQEGAS